MSTIKLTQDFLLVEIQDRPTEGAIILDRTNEDETQIGRVTHVGPGLRNRRGELIAMEIVEGDLVMFKKREVVHLQVKQTLHSRLRESEVIAIVGDSND